MAQLLSRRILVHTAFGPQLFSPLCDAVDSIQICYNGQHYDAVKSIVGGPGVLPPVGSSSTQKLAAHISAEGMAWTSEPEPGTVYDFIDTALHRSAGTTSGDVSAMLCNPEIGTSFAANQQSVTLVERGEWDLQCV
eukprot:5652993-Amphidinium_carterae.1